MSLDYRSFFELAMGFAPFPYHHTLPVSSDMRLPTACDETAGPNVRAGSNVPLNSDEARGAARGGRRCT